MAHSEKVEQPMNMRMRTYTRGKVKGKTVSSRLQLRRMCTHLVTS
jgi:hypothetical protein